MTTAKKLAKTTTVLMIITMASKVLGFARESVIAYFFGGGMEAEAYFMALSIPNLIFASVGASISTTFIPLYTNLKSNDGIERANRFASNLLNIIGIISCFLLTIGIILSPQLVRLLAPGFTGELYTLTIELTRILFLGAIFSMASSILTGILQSNESFYGPAMAGFSFNIIIITGCILFAGKFGIYALTVGYLAGTIMQTLIKAVVIRDRYTHKPIIDFRDPLIKKLILLIVPVIIGTAIRQLNTIVDKALASNLELGSISAINYSNRLVGFVDGIFTSTVMVVIYPFFSQMSAREDYDGLNTYISSAINIFTMLLLPITVITIIYSEDIVRIVFERGVFSAKDVALTSYSLKFLALGFLPYSVRQIFNRAFYARQDTKTPMVNGALAVAINVVADFMLVGSLQVGGLSLATSLSYLAANIFFIISWQKTMHCSLGDILDFKGLAKLLISFTLFTALVWFLSFKGIHLFITTIIAGIVYLGLLWITKVKELQLIISHIEERFSKK